MKLVVGMGTIDDYPALVKAGADEVFCGYIPAQWGMQRGEQTPMNRREVLFPNVQIGSESELAILADMQEKLKVPVTLTLNAPYYDPEALCFLQEYVQRCGDMGFQNFIIADENLIRTLNQISKTKEFNPASYNSPDDEINDSSNYKPRVFNKKNLIHLSGEYGELNRLVLEELNQYKQITRIIFPRQTTIVEMKRMIPHSKANTFEAFFLNEKCHFTGAYCNSIHSDFFCHMCQVPYQKESDYDDLSINLVSSKSDQIDSLNPEDFSNSSGCGYCALWKLREAGITHLKIVSRGNFVEDTIDDVKRAKQAIALLASADSEQKYIQRMKEALFPNGCSGNCYYM